MHDFVLILIGLVIGTIFGVVEEYRFNKKRHSGVRYTWVCPAADCDVHIESNDHDSAVDISVDHMKRWHLNG